MDDQIYGLADGAAGDLGRDLGHQVLQAVQSLLRRVRVDGREASWVAGVPGLERLQRGGAFAHLADDDPIRAHAQRVAHEIDDADRLGRATGQGGDDIRTLATISYDPLSRRTATRFGDGSHQLFDFKADGDLLRIRSIFPAAPSKNVSYQYAYDGAGNAIADFIDNVEYRSTNEHDANIKTYAQADGLNRYWSAGGKDLAYWWEGPMSGDSQFGYHYDEQNRLKLVTSGNGLYESLARDAMGQLYYRAHKPDAGNLSYNYITGDGIRPEVSFDNVITVANGAPAVGHGSRQYFLGPNPDERLAYRDIYDVVRYPHVDRLGSMIALADGASVQPFRYSSFGESEEPITGLSGPLSYGFRYTGQRISPFTRQYDYKARTYAPKLGRFLEPDPSGFTDGPNLYAYVLNDPLNNTDPTGMETCNAFGCYSPASAETRAAQGAFNAIVDQNKNENAWMVGVALAPVAVPFAAEAVGALGVRGVITRAGPLNFMKNRAIQSLRESVKSLERNVVGHRQKLDDYRRDPDKFDNQNRLANARTPAERQKIIQGREAKLQRDINKNASELAKARDRLEETRRR